MEIEITFLDGRVMTFDLKDARFVLSETTFSVFFDNDDEPDVCLFLSDILCIEFLQEVD